MRDIFREGTPRPNHHASEQRQRRAAGPVRHLTAEEYAMAPRHAPAPVPAGPSERSALEQVEALLRITNRVVAGLEKAITLAGALTGAELAQLSQVAGTLACLVGAQRTASKQDGDGSDMTDAELAAVAGRDARAG